MIDELNSKYDEFKEVVNVLPVNTKYNRKRKVECIDEQIANDNKLLDVVKAEIETRLVKLNKLTVNDDINKLEQEIEKCNIVNEWNQYNYSYAKMHLDYYLYQLHRYYKEDLESVNACIKKILESFNKVEINIVKDDLDFNNYAATYMDKVISGASQEELSNCFEEIYWKNSDIIKILEINFKSIYLRNEKKIDKYYETRHQEFLKKHNDSEIYDMRIKLSHQIDELKGKDAYLNFNKFIDTTYKVNEYTDEFISKKREMFFNEGSYSIDNLMDIKGIIDEYNVLIKYKYLFSDMKERLEKKDTLKNSKSKALKEITKAEGVLKKINAKQNSKGLFGKKKKNDEKWLFDYKKAIDDIMKCYDEFDNACFDDLVFNKLSMDSSILEVLKLICSNYLYFVNKTYEVDEQASITDITDKFNDLKNYVYNNNFTLLNNIALLDEKQMKQLIVDKFKLENININIDNLLVENVDNTIEEINKLINYENILASGINVSDVSLYLENQKLKG